MSAAWLDNVTLAATGAATDAVFDILCTLGQGDPQKPLEAIYCAWEQKVGRLLAEENMLRAVSALNFAQPLMCNALDRFISQGVQPGDQIGAPSDVVVDLCAYTLDRFKFTFFGAAQ